MATKRKVDEKEIRKEARKLTEEIESLRERAREKGLAFACLSEEELVKKIKGETSNSPYIYAQSWTSGGSPGSSASYTVYISNPDPTSYFPLYASICFGLGNVVDVADAWNGRDTRWISVSSDRTFMAAGATANFTFNYNVPSGVETGTYNGNTVVWQGDWHDTGTVFDRGSFDIEVS